MLNKYMLSRGREKLGVLLIFLENRDTMWDRIVVGRGELLWESKHEPQPAGFMVVMLRALGKRHGFFKSKFLETGINKAGVGLTGSLCMFLNKMITLELYTEDL